MWSPRALFRTCDLSDADKILKSIWWSRFQARRTPVSFPDHSASRRIAFMPPRKTTKVAAPAAPLPKPNAEHPCHPLLCSTTADLATRSHPPAYHVFFNSTASRASSPPPKKKQKKNEDKLPAAIEYAWEPQRIQDKLIQWFDGRREDRKMPWRKDVVPSKMTKKERSQRGYEVR